MHKARYKKILASKKLTLYLHKIAATMNTYILLIILHFFTKINKLKSYFFKN